MLRLRGSLWQFANVHEAASGPAAESLFREVLSCTREEPRVCQGVVFCECGLTLQEVRYWAMLNGPVYRREIGKHGFTRWMTGDTRDADFRKFPMKMIYRKLPI